MVLAGGHCPMAGASKSMNLNEKNYRGAVPMRQIAGLMSYLLFCSCFQIAEARRTSLSNGGGHVHGHTYSHVSAGTSRTRSSGNSTHKRSSHSRVDTGWRTLSDGRHIKIND